MVCPIDFLVVHYFLDLTVIGLSFCSSLKVTCIILIAETLEFFFPWQLVLITSANVLVVAYLSSSYDKAKHIVEVDDRILSVFIVDPTDSISDLFIANNANIDESFVEKVRNSLKIKFEEQLPNHPLGARLGIY